MAELASAILTFVVAGLSTWKTISAALDDIRNASRNYEHWTMVGTVLEGSFHLMEDRMKQIISLGPDAPISNSKLEVLQFVDRLTTDFDKDLSELKQALEKQRAPKLLWTLFKGKLREDSQLIVRLSRHVHLFNMCATCLTLLEPASRSGHNIRSFFDELYDGALTRLPNKPPEEIQALRDTLGDALFGVAEDADSRLSLGSSSVVSKLSSAVHRAYTTSNSPDCSSCLNKEFEGLSIDPTMRSDSLESAQTTLQSPNGSHPVSFREYRFRLDSARKRAQYLDQAGLPTLARKAQEHAINIANKIQLEESASKEAGTNLCSVKNEELIDLEVIYIRILLGCERKEKGSKKTASQRLEQLKTNLNEWCHGEVITYLCNKKCEIGDLCVLMGDHRGAINCLRGALFGYLEQDTKRHDPEITRIARTICEEYECLAESHSADAFRRILVDRLGKDPTMELDTLTRAVDWCRRMGFDARIENERMSIPPSANKKGNSPLHEAVFEKDMDMSIFHQLLHTCPMTQDGNKNTPLLVAVERSNLKVLAELLRFNDSVHVRNASGQTPLHICRDRKVLRLLLEYINKPPVDPKRTSQLVNIDSTDRYMKTALHCACDWSRPELVEELVQQGADVNVRCGEGNTPLMSVCRSNRMQKPRLESIVRILVNYRSDISPANIDGVSLVWKGLKNKNYGDQEIERMLTSDPTLPLEPAYRRYICREPVELDASDPMHLVGKSLVGLEGSTPDRGKVIPFSVPDWNHASG